MRKHYIKLRYPPSFYFIKIYYQAIKISIDVNSRFSIFTKPQSRRKNNYKPKSDNKLLLHDDKIEVSIYKVQNLTSKNSFHMSIIANS